jgi:ribonuclease HI
MAKKKYYVVWQGVEPGIYDSWTACQLQIKGYPGAKYASFKTLELAQKAYEEGHDQHIITRPFSSKKEKPEFINGLPDEVVRGSWAVDAACSGNPGIMEYRGVVVDDQSEVFHMGPFPLGTNNIGEFLAIVHAAALLKKVEQTDKIIYTDSRTALSWVKRKKVKTNLKQNEKTKVLYQLIERAENWIKLHGITNPLIKWDTENWGEIPADFGRK